MTVGGDCCGCDSFDRPVFNCVNTRVPIVGRGGSRVHNESIFNAVKCFLHFSNL